MDIQYSFILMGLGSLGILMVWKLSWVPENRSEFVQKVFKFVNKSFLLFSICVLLAGTAILVKVMI